MRDGLELDDGLDVGIEDEPPREVEPTIDEVLVGTKELAALWRLNREFVTDWIVKRPDFPQPALRMSAKTRRWRLVDCKTWRQKHSGR